MIDHTKPSIDFKNSDFVLGGDIDDRKENLENEDIAQKMTDLEKQAIQMIPSTPDLPSR